MAAAEVGEQAQVCPGPPDQARLGRGVAPALPLRGGAGAALRVAAAAGDAQIGRERPARGHIHVQPGAGARVFGHQIKAAKTLQQRARARLDGMEVAPGAAALPRGGQPPAPGRRGREKALPLHAARAGAPEGGAHHVLLLHVGVLPPQAQLVAQALAAPAGAAGGAPLPRVAVRVALVEVEQPVARRVAVAQHLAGVAIGAAGRQRAGDVVAQVRPAQPQAAFQAASAAPARIGLHAFALAIRVMAKAPVALAAEAHARIQPAFDAGRAQGRLPGAPPEAAGLKPRQAALAKVFIILETAHQMTLFVTQSV